MKMNSGEANDSTNTGLPPKENQAVAELHSPNDTGTLNIASSNANEIADCHTKNRPRNQSKVAVTPSRQRKG